MQGKIEVANSSVANSCKCFPEAFGLGLQANSKASHKGKGKGATL